MWGKAPDKGSPFRAWAKKLEKVFKPTGEAESGSEDLGNVHAAVGQMQHLQPDHRKEVEKAVRDQLTTQREQDAELRRQELLDGTAAKMPWKPKARPGDEMYPKVRSKSKREAAKRAGTSAVAPSPSSSKSAKTDADVSQSSGLEPPPIDDDEEDASSSSVRASSLRLVLEDMVKDAKNAERSHVDPSTRQKSPQAMTPTELIDLRRRDEEAWRRLIRENTIMAVAASMPTDDDQKKAADTAKKAATHRTRVKFNDAIEIILVPVGQPFAPNEQRTKQAGQIELEKTRKT